MLSEKHNVPFIIAGAPARLVEGKFFGIFQDSVCLVMIAFGNDIDTTRDNRVCLACEATEKEVGK